MELIKDLGKKQWVGGTGRKESATFGLFLCPSCNQEVEKRMNKGLKAKGCGNPECTKKLRKHNPNSRHSGAKTHGYSTHKYYSAFKSAVKSIDLSTEDVAKLFRNYVKARDTYKGHITLNSDKEWVEVRHSACLDEIRFDTKYIADKVGTAHTNVINTVNKLIANGLIDKVEEETIVLQGKKSFPVTVLKLTQDQYTRVLSIIEHSSTKNTSNCIYLIKCDKYIKIGIAYNVQKRFKTLQGANAFPLELYFHKKINNAGELERRLHLKYDKYRHHHEWFNLTPDQIDEIIEEINLE